MPNITPSTRSALVEHHGEDIAVSVETHMGNGATEKQAVAVALRDAGLTNEEVGLAFGPVFGSVTKSGGAGNVVTAGLRALGRDAEITGAGHGGGRKVVVRDGASIMRDEIDRLNHALETVNKPVSDMDEMLTRLDAEPGVVVDERVTEIDAERTRLAAEKKTLLTPDGATAYVAERRTSITARRDALVTGTEENAERMRAAIAEHEAILAAIAGIAAAATPPTTEAS